MKKTLVIIAVLAAAMISQAATLTWDSGVLQDTQSGNGYLYTGTLYATAGVDLYLIYNGTSGTAFGGVEFDTTSGVLEYAGTDTAISFYQTTITDGTDYDTGAFSRSVVGGVNLTTFTPNAIDWNSMDYSFTILAVVDTDDDYVNGAYYGTFTGDITGNSEAFQNASDGYISAGVFDASGSGLVDVVPEPATIGLFGLGALSAWILRRNKAKQA